MIWYFGVAWWIALAAASAVGGRNDWQAYLALSYLCLILAKLDAE